MQRANKVYSGHDDYPSRGNPVLDGAQPKYISKRKNEGHVNVEESKQLARMQRPDFKRVSSIQFCVDGAVGLPSSVTATRVTARLIDYNRCQIGEPSASSISNPDSSVSAPIFDLHAGWRGMQLFPHLVMFCWT